MRRIGLPLLLVAVSAVAADEPKPTPKFPLGKETTFVEGPLDAAGYLDFEAALNERLGKGITPEKNANALLFQAFGPKPEGATMPPEFFKALGIAEPPEKGDYFVGLYRYAKDQNLDPDAITALLDEQTRCAMRPWSAKDHPQIAAWLGLNAKPLAVVREATTRPDYFNPLCSRRTEKRPGSSLTNVLLPNVQKCREIAAALLARAMLRLDAGEFDAAWDDMLACHRLGRLVGRGGTIIEYLVGAALESLASNAELVYLERANLTAKQLRERMKELQALPPMPTIADKVDLGARLTHLDTLQTLRRGGPRALDEPNPEPPNLGEQLALATMDFETPLRQANQTFDRLAAALRLADRPGREKALDAIQAGLEKRPKEPEGMAALMKLIGKGAPIGKQVGQDVGRILLALTVPALRKTQDAADRIDQVGRNVQVAFALAAYRADKGGYPDKLDALAPAYLPAVPGDLFSGGPLVYKPDEKGYLLYSVGINGKDEEGRWIDDVPRGDDPGVRMPLPPLKPRR